MTAEFGLRLTRRAERDIQRAAEWWELNRSLAPGAVKLEVTEACELLQSQPGVGARAIDTKTAGVRRFHLSRIHHFLYYRIRGGTVEVLALWHTSRGRSPGL